MLGIVMCVLGFVDASRLYHSIRGQSVIKLYVIFNVFEVFDRLCCSFGLDILDSFLPVQLSPGDGNGFHLHPIIHFLLSVIYICKIARRTADLPIIFFTSYPL